jgi:hypothetical protein
LQPLPKVVPTFDVDKRIILWSPATVPAPGLIAGYTVIATDRVSNISKEYKTKDLSVSTVDWTAGEYWVCVKVRSSIDESECVFSFARVFEKLPTVKFSMNSYLEEITWDPIVTEDPNRKIEYVVKAWSKATDKITDFPAFEGKFSTLNWDEGGYWICVQATSPGAESLCPSYWSYTIDRKANAEQAAAELKANQEAKAKAIIDKAAADKIIQEAKLEAERILAAQASVAAKKKTITCVKGKLTKKVTAVKPKCPIGYKVKK